MLGLQRGTVKLVAYNPAWEKSFAKEAKKIAAVFSDDALDIQHVGSTAIPGIVAKPIVDIGVTVSSLKQARKYIDSLQAIGYTLKLNDPRAERLFFTKGPEEKRTHYLHIGESDHDYIADMVTFRDYLRNNPDEAHKYSELKKKLAVAYADKREVYTAQKEAFVKNILEKTILHE